MCIGLAGMCSLVVFDQLADLSLELDVLEPRATQ